MNANIDGHWWSGDARSIWTINLNRTLPLSLNIDSGASDMNIDLSQVRTKDINVKTGVSRLDLKLGGSEDITTANIDSGVSSITVHVPNGVGVQLKLDSGLTIKNLADLSSTGDKLYESAGYNQSSHKSNIVGKLGLSSFTIERY